MKWREEYATGIRRIDEQHKTIFKTAENFQSAIDTGAGESRYVTNGYIGADAQELVNTVDNWLDKHICRIDVHLKKCVKK